MPTAAEMRITAAKLIASRAGKNSYTQGSDRDYFFGKPEGASKGYSDCSSSVRACIKRAAGIDIGGNTSAQISNRAKGLIVEDNRDGSRSYPTLSKLQPGDCIYYKGNVSHAWSVGHVEMNYKDGIMYGHGSGMGPTKHDVITYSKSRTGSRGYLCVIRWILDDKDTGIVPANPLASGPAQPIKLTHGIQIIGGTVNVRTGPSTDYEIVGTVKQGEIYADAGEAGWYPVVINGRVLWVSNNMSERV